MDRESAYLYNDFIDDNRYTGDAAFSQDNPRRSRSAHRGREGEEQQYEMVDVEGQFGTDNGRPTNGLTRRKTWSAHNELDRETAKLLANLPSRQLETLATSGKGTVRLNHRRMKSFHDTGDGIGQTEEIANMMNNNPELEECTEEEIHTLLKGMTTTLSSKRAIRRQVSKKKRQLGWFTQMKYDFAMSWQHFKYSLAELMYSLELWKSHLKLIEGHFGTGVTSYFLFLKWLFLINIPVFLLTLGFVVLPQVLYRWHTQVPTGYPSTNTTGSQSFTGAELLNGKGWFENTELYYGFYTNETIQLLPSLRYNMIYAYLFTCGGYYLLCLFILAVSILRSYRTYYIDGSGEFNYYFKVFNGWDYGITSQEAARLKQKSLYSELMEYLSGFKKQKNKTLNAKCQIFWLRLLTNLIVLALLGSSGYLIYYISESMQVRNSQWLEEFAMPLCITAINLILPPVFNAIEVLEAYSRPKTQLYVHMIRTMTLKGVTLVVLVNFWFSDSTRASKQCWETFMGQEIYRLVIVDFIFTLLVTFFFEFIRKILATYCIKRLSLPEFNIGRNTMDLIYSQTLCWLGTFYCPLLSFIVIIKLVIIFYVKRVSVLQNCQPSMRPWRAARSHTIFLAFLFCFFLLSTVAVACGIIFVQPSEACGPYKGHNKTYAVVTDLVDEWREEEEVLAIIIDFISSPGCIAAIVIFLGMGTYYLRLMMIGHKEMVTLLEQQLALEGKDKNFLLEILQNVNKKTKNKDRRPNKQDRPLLNVDSADRPNVTSPGGRTFIKQVAESSSYATQT